MPPAEPVERQPESKLSPAIAIAESEPNPTETQPTKPKRARSSLPEPILRDLYACWLESPYPYMFDAPPPGVRAPVIDQIGPTGTFMAGVGGIMHYGSLSTCMGRIAGVEKTSYSAMNTVEAFSGLSVGIDGAQWRDPTRFNVELVRWGRASLIPDPGMIVQGDWTAGELYELIFSRFFRLMAHSYLELQNEDRLAAESQAYFAATRRGLDGLDYLEGRFAGELPEYGGAWDGTQWTPAMSYGFWMRRAQDGTDDELWLGLRELLELYDPVWLSDMRARYPKVARAFSDAA